MDPTRQRLARAREYPYAIPKRSYVYRDSGATPFDESMTRDRTPVLAVGSNQAPERLAQKFGHDATHLIPVQRAALLDFDIVYSAHVASYGAVPAMLQRSEQSRVSLAVTWLDDEQLEIMHRSEISAGNYSFAEIDRIHLRLDDGHERTSAYAYLSTRGHLNHEGAPVALAAIECEQRRYRALNTAEVLEQVRERVAARLDSDTFIHRLVDDAAYRREVIVILSSDATRFSHPRTVLREGPTE